MTDEYRVRFGRLVRWSVISIALSMQGLASAQPGIGFRSNLGFALARAETIAQQQAKWSQITRELEANKALINERESRLAAARDAFWSAIELEQDPDPKLVSEYYALLRVRDEYHREGYWASGIAGNSGFFGGLALSMVESGVNSRIHPFAKPAFERWAREANHPIKTVRRIEPTPTDEIDERYEEYVQRRMVAEYLWEFSGSPLRSANASDFLPAYLIATGTTLTADEARELLEQRERLFGPEALASAARLLTIDQPVEPLTEFDADKVHLRYIHKLDRLLAESKPSLLPAYFIMRGSHGTSDWDRAIAIHTNRIARWGEERIDSIISEALDGYADPMSIHFRRFDGEKYEDYEGPAAGWQGREGRLWYTDPVQEALLWDDQKLVLPFDVLDYANEQIETRGVDAVIWSFPDHPFFMPANELNEHIQRETVAAAVLAQRLVPSSLDGQRGFAHSYDLAYRDPSGVIRNSGYTAMHWLITFLILNEEPDGFFFAAGNLGTADGEYSPESVRQASARYIEWRKAYTDDDLRRAFDAITPHVTHYARFGNPTRLAAGKSIRQHAAEFLRTGRVDLFDFAAEQRKREADGQRRALAGQRNVDALKEQFTTNPFRTRRGNDVRPQWGRLWNSMKGEMPKPDTALEAFETMRTRWVAYLDRGNDADRQAAVEAKATLLNELEQLRNYLRDTATSEHNFNYGAYIKRNGDPFERHQRRWRWVE